MQRAGHEQSVSARAATLSPNDASKSEGHSVRLLDEKAREFENKQAGAIELHGESSPVEVEQKPLEVAVRQRIESRLPGRVRNLVVRTRGDVIILEGECNTYYTKQIAQHAAMGILEDEHLQNAIVVALRR